MDINKEIIRLAQSIYTNPGAYILLIGSGLSTSAGIPTAWGIMIDIAKNILCQIDEANKDLTDEKIKTKFEETYGNFTYENLLTHVATTQNERSRFLKKYIEPSDDDLTQGNKITTEAHIAIAQLIQKGYLRIIVTTNFDRLIENALTKANMACNIIIDENDIVNTPPFHHLKNPLLVKVNGDYLSTCTLNLELELEDYSNPMKDYLASLFKSHGVISCGWSAMYDTALRKILENNPCNFYASYLTEKDNVELCPEALNLKDNRKMDHIKITDANVFFQTLSSAIESIENLTPKNINLEVFQRNVVNPLKRPDIQSQVLKIVDTIVNLLHCSVQNSESANTIFQEDILHKHTVELCSLLMSIIDLDRDNLYLELVTTCIERLCVFPKVFKNGTQDRVVDCLEKHANYPCLIIFIACVMTALKREKLHYLLHCFEKPKYYHKNNHHHNVTSSILEHINFRILHDKSVQHFVSTTKCHMEIIDLLTEINESLKIFSTTDEIKNKFHETELLFHIYKYYFYESKYNSCITNDLTRALNSQSLDSFISEFHFLLKKNPSILFNQHTENFKNKLKDFLLGALKQNKLFFGPFFLNDAEVYKTISMIDNLQ